MVEHRAAHQDAIALTVTLFTAATLTACAASGPAATRASGPSGSAAARPATSSVGPAQDAALGPQRVGSPKVAHVPAPRTSVPAAPSHTPASNGTGIAAVPAAGQPVSIAHPDHVIGDGTAGGCTSQAVVDAVAAGGVITFSCGPKPVTITMEATATVRNTSAAVVLDGQGKVTLSGAGARTGTMQIQQSQLRGNLNAGFQTSGFPGIFFLGRGQPALTSTTDS